MARVARRVEENAIYHLLLKGCSDYPLFRDGEDYKLFISKLFNLVEQNSLKLYCYCLMSDHVHIVCKPDNKELSVFMKQLTGGYASYYNRRYKRSGPVFAGRFKSEIVEHGDYLKRLIRFILQDPVRLKLAVTVTDYPYSSAMNYILPPISQIEIEEVLSLFGSDNSEAKAGYIKYTANRSAEWFMDENAAPKLKIQHRLDVERRCWKLLSDEFGLMPADLPGQKTAIKKAAIAALRKQGATLKQIMALTGCSYYTVQKVSADFHNDFTVKD